MQCVPPPAEGAVSWVTGAVSRFPTCGSPVTNPSSGIAPVVLVPRRDLMTIPSVCCQWRDQRPKGLHRRGPGRPAFNRLLQYLHRLLEGDRQCRDHLGEIQNGLRGLADCIHETCFPQFNSMTSLSPLVGTQRVLPARYRRFSISDTQVATV